MSHDDPRFTSAHPGRNAVAILLLLALTSLITDFATGVPT